MLRSSHCTGGFHWQNCHIKNDLRLRLAPPREPGELQMSASRRFFSWGLIFNIGVHQMRCSILVPKRAVPTGR